MARLRSVLALRSLCVSSLAPLLMFCSGCGGSSSSPSGGGGNPPATPSGLVATAGDQHVSLSWTASTGATSYHVKRGTASGGPYTQVANVTTASDTDTG